MDDLSERFIPTIQGADAWSWGVDSKHLKPELCIGLSPMVKDVWSDKYRQEGETWGGMCHRVCQAIYASDLPQEAEKARAAMHAGLWMPAGRILAGAGTAKRVTLMNCFVNGELEDDMASIATGLGNIMLTQQQGGGIGTDFTPLRPPGAILRRTGAVASGPGPFIDTWDSACATIRSAGDRRGAMMTTLGCWHPFLPEFVIAKHEQGRWTNMNVSVLITDAFMSAVEEDEDWLLYHKVPPAYERDEALKARDFVDDDTGVHQYVYSVRKARELWEMILQSTYEYAEPGVIFIDRVNDANNLSYLEDIQCTNPCGEQPLPPHGACNLGAVNLSRMVKKPFTEEAEFDWDTFKDIIAVGVRFLDNVVDVSNYPLPEQAEEQRLKRRIGIGMAGLCDAMHQLGMRYGSPRSIQFAERVTKCLANEAYRASSLLALEKGTFPTWDAEKFNGTFINQLDMEVIDQISNHGLRNGVLMTIAPTGTTSIAYGNTSAGLEPVFAHESTRKVRQPDDSWKEYTELGYGARLWKQLYQDDPYPAYMNECKDVAIHEHVRIQEACQKWVDASISKTINLPEDISYDDFCKVYTLAYESGLKGCTTYRPSEVRGSILSTGTSKVQSDSGEVVREEVPARPEELASRTIKVKWPNLKSSLYLTVGYLNDEPFEVFLNSKDQSAMEWMTTTTLLMSLVLRKGVSLETLADEFTQVHSLEGGWAEGQYYPSLIAYLGSKLRMMDTLAHQGARVAELQSQPALPEIEVTPPPQRFKGEQCPHCRQYSAAMSGGCLTCTNCGWSKCD